MRLERPITSAGYSLLFVGLGQLSQERGRVALWHFLAVVTLLVLAVVDESHRHLWVGFALAVYAWSVIDAFIWEIRRRQARAT
jgi:hypothetical protein